MSFEVEINLVNAQKLQRKLQHLGNKAFKAALRKATREGAKVVKPVARSLAPVATGALKNSLKVKAFKRSRKWIGAKLTTNDKDNLFTGEQFYGAFLEYGTKYISAREYLQEAARKSERKALNTATEAALKEIERQATKGNT